MNCFSNVDIPISTNFAHFLVTLLEKLTCPPAYTYIRILHTSKNHKFWEKQFAPHYQSSVKPYEWHNFAFFCSIFIEWNMRFELLRYACNCFRLRTFADNLLFSYFDIPNLLWWSGLYFKCTQLIYSEVRQNCITQYRIKDINKRTHLLILRFWRRLRCQQNFSNFCKLFFSTHSLFLLKNCNIRKCLSRIGQKCLMSRCENSTGDSGKYFLVRKRNSIFWTRKKKEISLRQSDAYASLDCDRRELLQIERFFV